MKIINVGIIGLGYWGPNLVRNFQQIPNARVLIVSDLIENNLKKISKLYPKIKTTLNYKELLSDSAIDLVVVATPVRTHFSISKEALTANKHVLIEKPMTQSTKEALILIKLAKKMKKIIMVDHTFIYSEPVRKIKQIIDQNKLGEIYYYDSTRINLGLIQEDTNVIWDLAPHDFSIILHLIKNKPISISAHGASYISKKNEEVAHIIIKFPRNVIAHIHVSWLSPVKIRDILIAGSKKMIVYNDIEPSEKIKIYNKSVYLSSTKITPFAPAYRSGDVIIPHLEQKEALLTALSHFVDCIINNTKPLTGGNEGYEVVKLLEAASQSLSLNKEIKI